MKYLVYIFLLSCTLLLLSSCEKVVDLDLPQEAPLLVVDGSITDTDGPQEVLLFLTSPYFDASTPTPVSKAVVTIVNDLGNADTLIETPANSGIYLSSTPGEVGMTYFVDIQTTDGKHYRSLPERIDANPQIDTIFYEKNLNEDEDENTEPGKEYIYDILMTATDYPGVVNFYRWKTYINEEFQDEPFDIFISNDDFLDGNVVAGFQINNENVYQGDTFRVEMLSISERYYEYMDLLFQQTAIIGGIFDTPPAPIASNLYNVDDPNETVLGYFYAAGVSEASVIAE